MNFQITVIAMVLALGSHSPLSAQCGGNLIASYQGKEMLFDVIYYQREGHPFWQVSLPGYKLQMNDEVKEDSRFSEVILYARPDQTVWLYPNPKGVGNCIKIGKLIAKAKAEPNIEEIEPKAKPAEQGTKSKGSAAKNFLKHLIPGLAVEIIIHLIFGG